MLFKYRSVFVTVSLKENPSSKIYIQFIRRSVWCEALKHLFPFSQGKMIRKLRHLLCRRKNWPFPHMWQMRDLKNWLINAGAFTLWTDRHLVVSKHLLCDGRNGKRLFAVYVQNSYFKNKPQVYKSWHFLFHFSVMVWNLNSSPEWKNMSAE